MVTNNASATSSQTGATQAHEGAENLIHMVQDYTSGGALGFMDRVGDAMNQRFNEMYSSENMHKLMDKVLDNLPPEIREGLSQMFNALSGALSGNEPAKSQEYESIKEVYGTGGTDNESVRMNSNFAQRDDAQFAAAVTIGNGSGAITEVNGIQYVNGKPVNDGDDDAAEFAEQVEAMSEAARERAWDKSMHSVAGMNLTGEEIDGMIDILNDPVQRQKLIERRAKEKGISVQEAEQDFDNAQMALELTKEKDRNHGTLSPEKEAELQRLNNNQGTREATQATHAAGKESFAVSVEKASTSQLSQAGSIDSRTDLLDNQFSSAPVLKKSFDDANASRVPLEGKNTEIINTAQTTGPKIASSGFDV